MGTWRRLSGSVQKHRQPSVGEAKAASWQQVFGVVFSSLLLLGVFLSHALPFLPVICPVPALTEADRKHGRREAFGKRVSAMRQIPDRVTRGETRRALLSRKNRETPQNKRNANNSKSVTVLAPPPAPPLTCVWSSASFVKVCYEQPSREIIRVQTNFVLTSFIQIIPFLWKPGGRPDTWRRATMKRRSDSPGCRRFGRRTKASEGRARPREDK